VETNTATARLWQALADPTRRRIFERIAKRPLAVAQIARGLPVTRPAVSQHLKVLEGAGLITGHRRGTRRLYRANPQAIARMRRSLDRLWESSLQSFQAFAELEEDKTRE